MERLKWFCDKKMWTETLNQGRPKTLVFNGAEYAHKAILEYQLSKVLVLLSEDQTRIGRVSWNGAKNLKNKTDFSRGLDPSALYASHKAVSGRDMGSYVKPKAMRRDISENSLHISSPTVSLHLAQPSIWKNSRGQDIRSKRAYTLSYREQSAWGCKCLFTINQPWNPQWIESRLLSRAEMPCLGWCLPIFLPHSLS